MNYDSERAKGACEAAAAQLAMCEKVANVYLHMPVGSECGLVMAVTEQLIVDHWRQASSKLRTIPGSSVLGMPMEAFLHALTDSPSVEQVFPRSGEKMSSKWRDEINSSGDVDVAHLLKPVALTLVPANWRDDPSEMTDCVEHVNHDLTRSTPVLTDRGSRWWPKAATYYRLFDAEKGAFVIPLPTS